METATVPTAKKPTPVKTVDHRMIRRPSDIDNESVKRIAKMWWDKHNIDCMTVWFQGLQVQPKQTIMAVMGNSVPGLALHSEPKDTRFFDELERLFKEMVS